MPWHERHWPERRITDPGREPEDERWLHRRIVAEANERMRAGDNESALTAFKGALWYPDWEVGNSGLYSMIAHVHAVASRYPEARKAQREYVRLLRLEYVLAEGSLPDPELGVIAAVNSTSSLGILIGHAVEDLESYGAGFLGGFADWVDP